MILINDKWYKSNTIEEIIEIIDTEVNSELASKLKELMNKILDSEYGKVDEYLYVNALQENRLLLENNENILKENTDFNNENIMLRDKVNLLEQKIQYLERFIEKSL